MTPQRRMPQRFRETLNEYTDSIISVWFRTTVNIDGVDRKAAAAFDVFRLIVAMEEDGNVIQGSVDYCDIRLVGRTVQAVIQEAADRVAEGADMCDYGCTIDELLAMSEEKAVLLHSSDNT